MNTFLDLTDLHKRKSRVASSLYIYIIHQQCSEMTDNIQYIGLVAKLFKYKDIKLIIETKLIEYVQR